jgi:hypothetical protein
MMKQVLCLIAVDRPEEQVTPHSRYNQPAAEEINSTRLGREMHQFHGVIDLLQPGTQMMLSGFDSNREVGMTHVCARPCAVNPDSGQPRVLKEVNQRFSRLGLSQFMLRFTRKSPAA